MTDPTRATIPDTLPPPAGSYPTLPPDASPELLVHEPCPIVLSTLRPDVALADAQDYLCRALHACDGLGAAEWIERPGGGRIAMPGRNGAFRDVVAYLESELERTFMGPLAPDHGPRAWDRSSCGMLVRHILWCLGLRLHGLCAPYQSGMVMIDLENIYRHAGAWVDARVPGPDGVWTLPEVGDVQFFAPQHVAMVTDVLADGTILSVDGGRAGGNDGGSEIGAASRKYVARGTAVVAGPKSVRGWGKLGPLLAQAREQVVLPMRVGA